MAEDVEELFSQSEVRSHLEKILNDKSFRRSESLSKFLRFVVEETLAGRGNRLKARTIAIRALGRKKNFDPKADPIVSIQAGRLRRAISEYYAREGHNDQIQIELLKGSYQPKFKLLASSAISAEKDKILPSPNRPYVAVVPLVDLDANQANAYVPIGITQGLISALVAFQEITVVDVPPLKQGETIAIVAGKLAKESNVRFVLSGSFRKTVTSIDLRMQLLDALSGVVLWTDKSRHELSESKLFDLEEDLARQVASTLADDYGVIPRAMTNEAYVKRPEELSVYDAVLRFRHYQCVVTDEARERAIVSLEKAIELDPDYALCFAMLSEAVCDAYGLRIDCRTEVVTRARELARRAIALEASCQHAHWALAYSQFHLRERRDFLTTAEKTIELNPNNGYLVGISAWAMALAGEWERGLPILRRVMAQNPYYPTWFHLAPFLDHYQKGDFEMAVDQANQFNIPTLAWDAILRAASLAQVGRKKEAGAALSTLMSDFPGVATDPAHYLRGYIFHDELVEQVVDGLRLAGWHSNDIVRKNVGDS